MCGGLGAGHAGNRHQRHRLDLDALDPEEEPGVGSPVAGGLRRDELAMALRPLHGDPRLRALEIVEYNPYADRGFVTARAIHDLCRSVIG